MKSFIIPIHPERTAKILNGDKTIIILKTAPKDWKDYLAGKTMKKPEPMTGYIYCTKGDYLHHNKNGWFVFDMPTTFIAQEDFVTVKEQKPFNGKVVAKFRLSEVEKVHYDALGDHFYTERNDFRTDVLSKSCLSYNELKDYYFKNEFRFRCYAWHISDLQIFDNPKELSDFRHPYPDCGRRCYNNLVPSFCRLHCSHNRDPERLDVWCDRVDKFREPITKAPESWMYVEAAE